MRLAGRKEQLKMSKLYKGIDISLYQGRPDFAKLRDSGIDFVIFKASQGRCNDYDAKENG